MGRLLAPLVVLVLAGCAAADGEPAPTDAGVTPVATPVRPTPSPTPTPAATDVAPPRDPPVAELLVSVTDDLVVRSEPEVSDVSEVYDVRLQPGDLVWVIHGPVAGSGYDWYQGQVRDPLMPDGWRTGWVAVADRDGTPWLMEPPPEGHGWHLLGEGTDGMPFTVGIATDADGLAAEWAEAGAAGDPPSVDFDSTLVIRFTHGVSGTCPEIELAGVAYDAEERIVFSVPVIPMEMPGYDGGPCTTDARPHAFIVGVDRDRLPDGEITVQLLREPGAGEPETISLP